MRTRVRARVCVCVCGWGFSCASARACARVCMHVECRQPTEQEGNIRLAFRSPANSYPTPYPPEPHGAPALPSHPSFPSSPPLLPSSPSSSPSPSHLLPGLPPTTSCTIHECHPPLPLQAAGCGSWLLDLRENPGGIVREGLDVAELLLPPAAPFAVVTGRSGQPVTQYLSVGPGGGGKVVNTSPN